MIIVNGFTSHDIQNAVNAALTNDMDTVFFPAGNYVITEQINIDLSSLTPPLERKGIKFLGDNSRLQLTNDGYIAFNITCPAEGQNNSRFLFENLWFYTDNVHRPSAIAANYACFLTVKDCIFYQVSNALGFTNGGMLRVIDSFFWGCNIAAYFEHCRDSVVNGCHAFDCDQGIVYQGNFNVNTDGGFIISNCCINACTNSGIKIHGAYAPIINDVVLEYNSPNILIENSQCGTLTNIFSGPSPGESYGIEFGAVVGEVNNDYWNISNVFIQSKALFSNMEFSTFTNFNSFHVTGPEHPDQPISAIKFVNSNIISLTGCHVRDLIGNISALYITSSCSQFEINGGIYEGQLKVGDGSETRPGGLALNGPTFWSKILFAIGPMHNETGDYFISNSGELMSQKLGVPKTTPTIIFTTIISPTTHLDFDVDTIIDEPLDWMMNHMRLDIVGGTYGSFTAASVDIIRVKGATNTTFLNNIGSTGSLLISIIAPNIIRMDNPTSFDNQVRIAIIEDISLSY